jgi:type IV pilus assembly protein PilE
MHRPPITTNSQQGFTLIELVITIAVLAILAGIAVPAYQDYVTRGRRAEAMSQLVELANRQEQFYGNGNFRYSSTLSVLNVNPTTLPGGHYLLAIPVATTARYTVRADALGTQADDTACYRFQLDSQNRRRSFASGGAETTDTANCWPQ